MSNTVYLVLPGYGNSDEYHWQSYFENHLPQACRIQQKSWDKPICSDWVTAIQESVIKSAPENVILVTHSLGGIALAHWAKQFETKIKGAFIVAPPDIENPYMDLGLESFTPIPLHKLPFPSIVIGSTNDHWATALRTQQWADHWGSELVFIGDAGHINSSSGHGHWEEGLKLLKNFVKEIEEKESHQ